MQASYSLYSVHLLSLYRISQIQIYQNWAMWIYGSTQTICKAIQEVQARSKVGMKAEAAFATKATKFFLDVMQNPKSTRNSFLPAAVVSLLRKQVWAEVMRNAYCLKGV